MLLVIQTLSFISLVHGAHDKAEATAKPAKNTNSIFSISSLWLIVSLCKPGRWWWLMVHPAWKLLFYTQILITFILDHTTWHRSIFHNILWNAGLLLVIVPGYTRKCQCQTSITVRKLQENNVNNAETVYLFLHPSLNFRDHSCDVVIPCWHHGSVILFSTLETITKTAQQK